MFERVRVGMGRDRGQKQSGVLHWPISGGDEAPKQLRLYSSMLSPKPSNMNSRFGHVTSANLATTSDVSRDSLSFHI